MRWVVLVSICLALAGCEQPALSRKPLFTARDSVAVSPLRDGIWLTGEVFEGCNFDKQGPTASWPGCVSWTLVAQGRIVRPAPSRNPKLGPASVPFILVAGDPPLMQEPDRENPGYPIYHAMKALASDAQGRIVDLETWTVNCPLKEASGRPAILVPGVRMTLNACHVADAAALRRLVKPDPSEQTFQTMHWFRDGDR